MSFKKSLLTVCASFAIAAPALVFASAAGAQAAVPAAWANCTTVNQRLPHGVGRTTAHDHTSGTPVTSFRHDTRLYNTAVNANGGLDRDHDGVACEKA